MAHFICSDGMTPVSRSAPTLPVPGSRVRLEADLAPPSPVSSTIASRHSSTSVSGRDLGDGDAPVLADGVEMLDRPAPAALPVELDQAVHQRLARHDLQLRIERGADRQAALVELLLAEHLGELAADLLGEIVGGEEVRQRAPRASTPSGSALAVLAFLGGDVAVLDHAVDHPVAALDGALRVAERVVVVRRLGQRGEIGRLGERQLVHRLVEIVERRRGDAIGAEAEEDLVEIELEDLVLGVGLLDAEREDRFLDLAVEASARW